MKIEVLEATSKGLLSVAVLHGTEEPLVWDARNYDRTTQSDAGGSLADLPDSDKFNRIFADINAYWAQLPPDRQNQIWNKYQAIHDVLMTNFESRAIAQKLQQLVKDLYQLMPVEEIKHWMLFHSGIRVPSTIKQEYGPDDIPTRTYLIRDYQDLIALSIAIRPMVPIWGEYIGRTKSEFGTTYKEIMALRLLYYTDLIQSPQIQRLQEFIEATMDRPEQQISFAAVMGGLGSAEMPEWMLATSLVRRISVIPLGTAQEEGANIIANVHQHVNNSLMSMDRRYDGRISEKKQPAASGEDPNNVSSAEMYKVRQQIADGDVVTINVYTENVPDMAMKVDPTLPMELVQICLEAIAPLAQLPVQQHQVILTQWVFYQTIQTIPQLTKDSLMRTMAVAQAALWHWGFYDLAALLTAEPLAMNQDMMIGVLESRGRIPREHMEDLGRHFPYQYHPKGKNQSVRQLNVASRSVDAFFELIVRTDWRLHAPQELVAKTQVTPNTRKLVVPADIRSMLARLIIFLDTPR